MRKLDNMGYLFNKFHSSDVFASDDFLWVVSDNCEQYPWLWKMSIIEYKSWKLLLMWMPSYIHIYIYIYIYINIYKYIPMNIYIYIHIHRNGFTSHFITISAKNSITASQLGGWEQLL